MGFAESDAFLLGGYASGLMPTMDGELISVAFQVRWRITDLKQFTFNLHELVEDELLLSLPMVPMHETCPVTPVFSAGDPAVEATEAKPNPFAVLGQLKKGK